jgi:ABC-type lipoprotein release transport system permease subunit
MPQKSHTNGVPAVLSWSRAEIRGRWRSLLVLGLLTGLSASFVFSAVAGARRTSTAYARFRSVTGRSDAIVFATQVGDFNADYSAVRDLPEVVAAGEFTLSPIGVKEYPQLGVLAPGDDDMYRTIDRPLIRQGRLPDPRRADEIVVNEIAARRFRLRVGRHVTLVSSTDINAFFGTAPLSGGPTVSATIVGIGNSNMDLLFGTDEPSFTPSAGFLATYKTVPRAGNLVVRLRPGTSVIAFRQHAASVLHLPTVPVRDEAEDLKRATHATDLERTALLLLAGCAALAGILLTGQGLTRVVYAEADSVPTLRAVGFTRRDLVAGLVIPLSLAALTAAVASSAAAFALSSRYPVGLAGRLEPDRGFHFDWPVLGLGALALAVFVVAAASLAGLRASSSKRNEAKSSAGSPIVKTLRRLAPLPAWLGASLALERGAGPRALPVRPALAGATAGLLGIVASFGLIHGIDDALRDRDRSGQVWNVDVFTDEGHSQATLLAALKSEHAVTTIAKQRRTDVDVEGAGLPAYALTLLQGRQSFVVLRGHEPESPDEVVLGPTTARALHKRLGDTVRIGGSNGREARVVGLALLPETPHSSFDQGLWLTPAVLDAISPPPSDAFEDIAENTLEARLAPSVSTQAVIARLQKKLGGNADIEPGGLPQDVLFLRNVRSLPKALAAFLALLGIGAVGHVLAMSVRRRRHDLAVLRAFGLFTWQAGACLLWQAITVALVGLAIGLPLGVAVGRWSWRWVADVTPLNYVAPIAGLVVLLSIPAAFAVAEAVAAIPAWSAARLRPAEVLRTE